MSLTLSYCHGHLHHHCYVIYIYIVIIILTVININIVIVIIIVIIDIVINTLIIIVNIIIFTIMTSDHPQVCDIKHVNARVERVPYTTLWCQDEDDTEDYDDSLAQPLGSGLTLVGVTMMSLVQSFVA